MPVHSPTSDATEIDPALISAQDRLISLWGEMGTHWGVPRSMAEIHALLFIAGREFTADEIIERLSVSRGTASMTLRTLVEWSMVNRRHHRGDRRDRYSAEQDVWKLFTTVLRARKRREFDPLLESLRVCRIDADAGAASERGTGDARPESHREHDQRIERMIELVGLLDAVAERLLGPQGPRSEELEALVRALAEAEQ